MRRAISSALTLAAALLLSVATACVAPIGCNSSSSTPERPRRHSARTIAPCISGSTDVSVIRRRQRGASPRCGFNSRKQAKITRQANSRPPNTARS